MNKPEANRLVSRRGFIMVQKADIALIGEQVEASASAKAVYLALRTIANDRGKDTFEARIALIHRLAHVSYRTAITSVHELERIGLLKVQRMSESGSGRPDTTSIYTVTPSAKSAYPSAKFAYPSAKEVPHGLPTCLKNTSSEEVERKGKESPPVFISDLKEKRAAKQRFLDRIANRYTFSDKASKQAHPKEYAEQWQLRKDIETLDRRIADFPI